MKRLAWLFVAAGMAALAQDTMHDAPVALGNGSVRATMRTDTLIDRTALSMQPHELMAHTHQFEHTLRITNPGKPIITISLKVNDVIEVKLSTGALLTVQQKTIPGSGGHVQGHAALAQKGVAGGRRNPRDVAAWLAINGHNESPDRMWVVAGPVGSTWAGTVDSDTAITGKIQATGTPSNHRHGAKYVTYQLAISGNTSVLMSSLKVLPNGHQAGNARTVELAGNGSFLICENRRKDGKVRAECFEALPGGGGTQNPQNQ